MEHTVELGNGFVGGHYPALSHQHWLTGGSQCGNLTDDYFALVCVHYFHQLCAFETTSGAIAPAPPLDAGPIWSGGQRRSTGLSAAFVCLRLFSLVNTGYS